MHFLILCTCTLTSSLYHSISGAGSLSARHSKVRCPLTGTVNIFTSSEPRRVGGTGTQVKDEDLTVFKKEIQFK